MLLRESIPECYRTETPKAINLLFVPCEKLMFYVPMWAIGVLFKYSISLMKETR